MYDGFGQGGGHVAYWGITVPLESERNYFVDVVLVVIIIITLHLDPI
jgi:hypothetical protein